MLQIQLSLYGESVHYMIAELDHPWVSTSVKESTSISQFLLF